MTPPTASPSRDWTVNPDTGRSNDSAEFHQTVIEVAMLIRGSSNGVFTAQWPMSIARLIVAHLAHKHGFAPSRDGAA